MNKEIRTVPAEGAEVRAVGNSRLIEGYGIIFNKESKLIEGRFTEVILPQAVDGLLETSDVLALMNHNESRGILARSTNGSGSMTLTKDSKGVKYSFIAPNTALGDELVEGIRRGDIRTSSFAFTVGNSGSQMTRSNEGKYTRTISKFEGLYDMSPVYREAYADTTVALRSLEEFEASELEDKAKILEAEAPVAETTESVPAEEIREVSEIDYSRYDQSIIDQKQLTDD